LKGALRVLVGVVATILVIAYPVLVYFGLTHWNPRRVALAMLAVVGTHFLLRMSRKSLEELLTLLPVTAAIASLAGISAWLDSATFILFTPALVNASLLATFAMTLRRGATPIIERFARLQHELTVDEVRWCRVLTGVWCGFFICNGLAIAALALFAPLSWWALYSGAISYMLVGLLGAGEYILRKRRFQRFSNRIHDRLLFRVLGKEGAA
jgi:uncharacterized membrane protein